ncbi:hypothetical protein [Bythopirellula goksoeyrii]|uniref:PEP-CTERM protein-sorting domain-containing protein n=1 Tax=Bythopirellula goksoeyrii TaxID=1400387 RepID=A0A5B9QJ74_9BACT|nr:hypothetical protein [Bythopirellula goksoeyrii]QEG37630.1 hypothetical protein Pr1d_49760 [Bythopirellula goksoeyrii]
MSNKQSRSSQTLSSALILISALSSATAAPRYRIELIGPEPNRELFQSVGIQSVGGLNNRGEVAFSYNRPIQITPTASRSVSDSFVSTATGVVSILDLGGQSAHALDITDSGLVVGAASSADSHISPILPNVELRDTEPFVSQYGHTIAIPTPERGFAVASAANNLGEVVGSASGSNGRTAFKWSEFEGYTDLGNFGVEYLDVIDINERSDILLQLRGRENLLYGDSYYYNGTQTVIYNNGSITQVPSPEFGITNGSAINDQGVVVGGFATKPGKEWHAFIWDEKNGFRDLGFEDEDSGASDINNSGVIIGSYESSYQGYAPFVYTEQDGRQRLIDLIDNPEGWSWLEAAVDINDRGQILGIGRTTDPLPNTRIYLATPIPEPSTLIMCLLVSLLFNKAYRHRSADMVKKTPVALNKRQVRRA